MFAVVDQILCVVVRLVPRFRRPGMIEESGRSARR
jgi:hypothetical protein